MILVIDNYDSFTFNLVQCIGELNVNREVHVVRNDAFSLEEVESWRPRCLILSPGPCTPKESGNCLEAIRRFAGLVPILGICLGHQCIGAAFGARIIRGPRLMHGKTSRIYHDGKSIFEGIPSPFEATRYHSLVVDRLTLPSEFEITANSDSDELMGIRHRTMPLEGVQFHPESFLTTHGPELILNFLNHT